MVSKKENTEQLIISAKSQLEKALENFEHLSGLDQHALGFAAHALGNYLTVIEGTIELLKLSLKEHPNQQIQIWLNSLAHATGLMLHTTNQLMGSSVGADPELIIEEVDLPMLTERICQFYQQRARRKKIKLETNIQVSRSYVKADRVALAAVFDNLLSNSVKYSEPNHTVFISLIEHENDFLWKVCDEGPGIPEDEAMELFKTGVQLSSIPTGKEDSSGYGLAVAKHLITKMGGRIWYEPNQPKGSCFLVKIPVAC